MTESTQSRPTAVGRLADPQASVGNDPRTHTGLLAALAAYGLDAAAGPPPVTRASAPEEIAEFVGDSHQAFEGLYAALDPRWPGEEPAAVDRSVETVTGVDGDPLELHVYRPRGVDGPLPAVVYLHGGAMTILDADNAVHVQWSTDLAAAGTVVITPSFRNAWTPEGLHPFPAGLEDCAAAIDWVHDHRADLGITRVVVQGESGGGNLALASALKARREGRLDRIDGVYAMAPYISGGYGWTVERKLAELPSMVENDGYYLNADMLDLMVAVYDPRAEHTTDPLAWPFHATEDDVRGLPPHVVSVNELDPLRDEGIAYFRTLQRAGVPVVGRVNLGLTHAAEMSWRRAVADAYRATVRDIAAFATSL